MASALRLGSALCRGLRPISIIPRRSYADIVDRVPLTFATPAQAFYSNVPVKQVDVNSTTGSFGILPMHVPSIAVLKPGLVTVYEEDKTVKYFASSGSVTINADSSVQILAEEAVPVEQLDTQAARQGLERCQQELASATNEVARAEAQIGVELHEAVLKAVEG